MTTNSHYPLAEDWLEQLPSELTLDEWAAQPIVAVDGCNKHVGFPTSHCSECRAIFDAANPTYARPYWDEV